MIAVVTGGSGFIGQHLVRRLLADGHEVRCLVRADGRGATLPAGASRHVVQFDSPATLIDCRALDDADAVFHLAAATRVPHSKDFIAANVTPTRHLLGALTARRQLARFVFVSSQAAAGPATALDRPVDEEDMALPVEAYGRSKLEAERIVESFGDRIPTTIVRPCAVFGPRDRDFLTLFRLAERGVLLYPGTAEHWLSILHVDDVVAGIIAVATSDAAVLRSYFLASEQPLQWRQLGAAIAQAIGRSVRQVNVPAPVVRAAAVVGDVIGRVTGTAMLASSEKAALSRHPFWICSARRARMEIGFQERRSLPDAVASTYLWYRDHGWLRSHRAPAAMA